MALAPTKLLLYSTPLSGCSARIRIASLLKNLPLSEHTLNLQTQTPYQNLNPNLTVPTLHATYPNGQSLIITQSLSMLSFLEESFPRPLRLLPPVTDMRARIQVQDLAALVACDIQPVQNSKVRRQLEAQSQDSADWAKGMLRRGIGVYEALAVKSAGQFSVGDELSWADICLYPMVQGALRLPWESDELLGAAPTVSRIMKALGTIDAFQNGGLQFNVHVSEE
ncbi:hypothetical protein MMC30_002558 [Trapelia coarctata]|nr:hypothetical protein [Trapelia coarctata]